MRLQKTALTQRIHKESLLETIRSDEANVLLLLEWGILPEQPLGWRSVWMLRQLLTKDDPRLKKHISTIIDCFSLFNESQKREWLKVLKDQTANDDEEGALFDLAISEWKNIHNHPALRASAVAIVFEMVLKYPELKNELAHLMGDDYLNHLSPGIKKGVMRHWDKLTNKLRI